MVLFQATRWLGLGREIWYPLSCGSLLLSYLLLSQCRKINKNIAYSLLFIFILDIPGFAHFSLLQQVEISQTLIFIFAMVKVFFMSALLFQCEPHKVFLLIHRFMLIPLLYGFFQWLLCAIGLQSIASIIDPAYDVVGSFPIYRVNSLWGESQHFAQVLSFYMIVLLINVKRSMGSCKDNNYPNLISCNWVFTIFLLLTSGSTTGYFLIAAMGAYLLCTNLLEKIKSSRKQQWKPIIKFSFVLSRRLLALYICILIALSIAVVFGSDSLNNQIVKQQSRISLLSSLLGNNDKVNSLSSGTSREKSYSNFISYIEGKSKLPSYTRDFALQSNDGFLLNPVRFGFLGSLLMTISLICLPLVSKPSNYSVAMMLGMVAILWFRGETILAASSQFCLLLTLCVHSCFELLPAKSNI